MSMVKQQILKIMDRDLNINKKVSEIEVQPPNGWINWIRTNLGMTLSQLAKKMEVSKPTVKRIEQREEQGSLTLKKLNEVADAMDLKLIYILIPKDGSFEKMVKKKAMALATEIVERSAITMDLEDQKVAKEWRKEEEQRVMRRLMDELPKQLWDS